MQNLNPKTIKGLLAFLALLPFVQSASSADFGTITVINLCNQNPMKFKVINAEQIHGCTTTYESPPINKNDQTVLTVVNVGSNNRRCLYQIQAGYLLPESAVYPGSSVTCSPVDFGLGCLCRDNGGAGSGPQGKPG